MRRAVAVMLKEPRPGRVKTRLCPALTPEEAASLYARFIADIFSTLGTLRGVDVYAAFAPEGSAPLWLIPDCASSFAQEGDGLGKRLSNVFKELFNRGYARAVVIGSDSPDLPARYVSQAFALLDQTTVVIGPAVDGGYYLIGMDRPMEALFAGVPWSTSAVLEKTTDNLHKNGIPFSLLPRWHDIDTPEDLVRLASNPGCPQSSAFAAAFLERVISGIKRQRE